MHMLQLSEDDWFEQLFSSQCSNKKILSDFPPQFLFPAFPEKEPGLNVAPQSVVKYPGL